MTKLNDTLNSPRGAIAFAGGFETHRFGPRFLFDGDEKSAEERAAAEAEKKAADEKAAADAAAEKAAADKKAADEKAASEAKAAEEQARKKAEEDAEKEKGGKLTEVERKLLHEAMERKAKQKAAEKERDDLAARLKAIEDATQTEAQKKAAEKAEAEKKAAEKAGDFERVKKMMADEHQKALDAQIAKTNGLQELLEKTNSTINDLTVGTAFAQSKFVNDKLVLTPAIARQVYGSHFEVENGVPVAYDKPRGAAERTKLVDASGDPIGFEAAITKLVESSADRDRLLRSNLKDGAGSRTEVARKGAETKTTQTGASRIAAALESGALKKKVGGK